MPKRKLYFIVLLCIIVTLSLFFISNSLHDDKLQAVDAISFTTEPIIRMEENCDTSFSNTSGHHPNLIVLETDIPFRFQKSIPNCNLNAKWLKQKFEVSSTRTDLFFKHFDAIYNSPRLITPPLLIPSLDFYIITYSFSLSKQRIHFPFATTFPAIEIQATLRQLLEQQHFPLSLASRDRLDSKFVSTGYNFITKDSYRCVFKYGDSLFYTSTMQIFETAPSASAYCKFDDAIKLHLQESKVPVKVLLVQVNSKGKIYRVMTKLAIQYGEHWNLNTKAIPAIEYPLQDNRFVRETRPIKLVMACSPLVWDQISKGIIHQWIEYHQVVGVEHFLVYIREDNTDNLKLILKSLSKYVEQQIVTLIHWQFGVLKDPIKSFQIPQIIDAFQRTADYSTWTIVSDTDEFFYPVNSTNLQDVLAKYEIEIQQNSQNTKYHELIIQNVFFGKIGKELSSSLVIGKFLGRYPTLPHYMRSKMIGYSGSDRFLTTKEVHYSDIPATKVPISEIQMNHYYNAYSARQIPDSRTPSEDSAMWARFGETLQKRLQRK